MFFVTGVNFDASHRVFNTQYLALVEAIDKIGERIRQLGRFVPTTSDYLVLGSIGNAILGATEFEIYKDLATDHYNLANQAIRAKIIANSFDDGATAAILDIRQEQHEDFGWKLLSMLPQPVI